MLGRDIDIALSAGEIVDEYGSYIVRGPVYSVLFARGPVFLPSRHRQKLAKREGAVCYVEGHLNANTSPTPNYAEAIVSTKADAFTVAFALDFTHRVAAKFGHRSIGVSVGVRGAALVEYTGVPSFVAEPGFISNPTFARQIASDEGQWDLGMCLTGAICKAFPGGLIALSTGHAYRDGRPLTAGDPGALVNREIDPPAAFDTEAECADAYLRMSARQLLAVGA